MKKCRTDAVDSGWRLQKGLRQRSSFAVDADLVFSHGFQQRTLGLRCAAVDLISQYELVEHRAGMELETAQVTLVDGEAKDIARQQVTGELDAAEAQPQHLGQSVSKTGLAHARQIFDQQMATRQQASQGPPSLSLFIQHHRGELFEIAIHGVPALLSDRLVRNSIVVF